jgi:hypothetical protein
MVMQEEEVSAVRHLKWALPALAVAVAVTMLSKELPAMRRYITIARM